MFFPVAKTRSACLIEINEGSMEDLKKVNCILNEIGIFQILCANFLNFEPFTNSWLTECDTLRATSAPFCRRCPPR